MWEEGEGVVRKELWRRGKKTVNKPQLVAIKETESRVQTDLYILGGSIWGLCTSQGVYVCSGSCYAKDILWLFTENGEKELKGTGGWGNRQEQQLSGL